MGKSKGIMGKGYVRICTCMWGVCHNMSFVGQSLAGAMLLYHIYIVYEIVFI